MIMKILSVFKVPERYHRLAWAVLYSNAVSLLLFFIRVLGVENFRYWFLLWNLLLAWLPLVFAVLLVRGLRIRRWLSWQNILYTFLWVGFLPNSFYVVSDLIHVHPTGEINILYDVVLYVTFIFNAYLFGFLSLYIIHRELLRRLSYRRAHVMVILITFASSFAVYLGRYLYWNSWDLLVHPFGILFDITDRIINPAAYPQTFVTTFSFFLLISSMYWVVYEGAKVLSKK